MTHANQHQETFIQKQHEIFFDRVQMIKVINP